MPIISIIDQPSINVLSAAYRPIVFKVEATATGGGPKPPVVYCDIYFNGKYYKSISKTIYAELLDSSTAWQFDIQDACQEYLGKVLGPNGGASIIYASNILVQVYCKFRSSGIDVNGFIQSDGTAPVQGTLYTQPVPGAGEQSNTFFVCNSTLQHDQNQNLTDHLNAYKKRTWADDCFPATHRSDNYRVGINQSDYFPILVSPSTCPGKLRLRYKYIGQSTYWSSTVVVTEACTAEITYVEGFPVDTLITIVWEAAGNVIGYEYIVDDGDPVITTDMSVVLDSLAAGAHSIAITPLCSCGEGATYIYNFSI